jgi:hypothetical protein
VRPALTRLWSLLAATALAFVGAVVVIQPAYACSCRSLTTREALGAADAVFTGTVTKIDRKSAGDQSWSDYRFAVTRVFKGTVYVDQVISSERDSAACGLGAEVGSQWVVFAQQTVKGTGMDAVARLSTSLCSGNIAAADAPRVLGAGREPQPGASDREERASGTDDMLNSGILWLGVGLLVAGAALATWIGLAWRPRPAE